MGDRRSADHGEAGQGPTPLPIADVLARVLDPLATWMGVQRWYAAKGAAAPPALSWRGWALLAEDEEASVVDAVVRARTASGEATYQVPLVLRPLVGGNGQDAADDGPGPAASADPSALIAVLPLPSGQIAVEDACRSDAGRRALWSLLAGAAPRAARGTGGGTGDGLHLDPAPVPGRAGGAVLASRLLSGEQSNSSMIFTLQDADPVILKLFRVLHEGANPDVVLQGALDRAGCRRIAPMIGSVGLRCEDTATATADDGPDVPSDSPAPALTADALLGQQFLPDVEDAWRVALQQAAGGVDFRDGARDLGAATAEVHELLASTLPTTPASTPERERVLAQMRERLDTVSAHVPQIARFREPLSALIDRAAGVSWPDLQRIHGDYHLGQVLAVPDRGWVLLDFEGEPLRPLAERTWPDCPVRDVAGMLRSLDYAGGAVHLEHEIDASAWVAESSRAFLDGYLSARGIDREGPSFEVLLRAFEADKAVYEVLYEARNRPDWLPIPLAALERLTGAAPTSH